jgi:hypothetical protein
MIAVRPRELPEAARASAIPNEPCAPAPEIHLWSREAAPFARDLLFMMALFFYVVGFAHQSSKMSRFGMEVKLGDQPLSNLFTWGAEAVAEGWIGFLLVFLAISAIMSAAGFLKHHIAGKPHCRPVVYGLVTFAVSGGLVATTALAWWTGGVRASQYDISPGSSAHGSAKPRAVWMIPDPAKRVAYLGTATAPTPVYILSETNDMFEVVATQLDGTGVPLAVHRSDVLYIQYRAHADTGTKPLRSEQQKVTVPIDSTPSPSQAGS